MAKTTGKKTKPMSKTEILHAIADTVGEEVSKKHVKQVVETLVDVAHRELKKSGIFVLQNYELTIDRTAFRKLKKIPGVQNWNDFAAHINDAGDKGRRARNTG